MKFAVFFLIAGICLIAVNATNIENLEHDLETLYDEEPVEIGGQTWMIFSKFFWVVWKALRFLKGVNCSIKEVMHIRMEVLHYPISLFSCNVAFQEPVSKLAASLNEVALLCNNIINLNSKVCNRENPIETAAMDEYQEIGGQTFGFFKCTFKLLKEFDALEHKLVSTVKLMKALPDAAFKVGGCMHNETESLKKLFTDFPSTIKTCSQLK